MTTFDDREKAFENKFAHDAELRFKAEARRNRRLGLWAAELLGHRGEAAEAYAQSLILADLEQAGDGDVLDKLTRDLEDRIGPEAIRDKMTEFLQEALADLQPPAP